MDTHDTVGRSLGARTEQDADPVRLLKTEVYDIVDEVEPLYTARTADTVVVPRVGFTGTRDGMTDAQKATVADLLERVAPRWVHHGNCVGADADFHKIARIQGLKIKGHPPVDTSLSAWCDFDEVAEPKPYLDRNRDIVGETTILIATPKETMDRLKGGTWYTILYARQQGKRVTIVWPDGSTRIDGEIPAPPRNEKGMMQGVYPYQGPGTVELQNDGSSDG